MDNSFKKWAKSDVSGSINSSGPPINTIQYLPLSILCRIFQYLDVEDKGRVARVCSDWRVAAYTPSLWCDVRAEVRLNRRCKQLLIATLAKRCITKVNVVDVGATGLRDLLDGVKSLRNIKIQNCYNATDKALCNAFARERPLLTCLIFSGCDRFTDVSVSLFAVNLKNLTSLKLQRCPNLTDLSMMLIGNCLVSLTDLYLGFLPHISDVGIGYLSGVNQHENAVHVNLKKLTIECCKKLTNRSLGHLSADQANIQSLSLLNSKMFTALGIQHLAYMTRLNALHLSTPNVGYDGLMYLARGSAKIMCLSLTGPQMAHYCAACGDVHGNTTDQCGCGRYCPYGDHLAVDRSLIFVGQMNFLVKLSLECCDGVTDVGLRNLARQQPGLVSLAIKGCKNITNEGLKYVARLNKLRYLDLVSCCNLDTVGLNHLMEGECAITNLTVTDCEKISPLTLCLDFRCITFSFFGTGFCQRSGLICTSW